MRLRNRIRNRIVLAIYVAALGFGIWVMAAGVMQGLILVIIGLYGFYMAYKNWKLIAGGK